MVKKTQSADSQDVVLAVTPVTVTPMERWLQFVKSSEVTASGAYNDERRDFVTFLGIQSEVGELLDFVKKPYEQGRAYERDGAIKEGGDIFWYLARVAERAGAPDDVLRPMYAGVTGRLWHDRSIEGLTERLAMLALAFRPRSLRGMRDDVIADTVCETICVVLTLLATMDDDCGLSDVGKSTDSYFFEVLDVNQAKLAARYPEGFSTEKSVNRDV